MGFKREIKLLVRGINWWRLLGLLACGVSGAVMFIVFYFSMWIIFAD